MAALERRTVQRPADSADAAVRAPNGVRRHGTTVGATELSRATVWFERCGSVATFNTRAISAFANEKPRRWAVWQEHTFRGPGVTPSRTPPCTYHAHSPCPSWDTRPPVSTSKSPLRYALLRDGRPIGEPWPGRSGLKGHHLDVTNVSASHLFATEARSRGKSRCLRL